MVAPSQKPDFQGGREPLMELFSKFGTDGFGFAALAFAVGLPNEVMLQIFDWTEEELETMKVSPRISELTNQIQVALNMDPSKRLAAAMNLAIDTKLHLLRTGDHKIKQAVSTDVMDRVLGKPLQTTQNLNQNLNVTVTGTELDKRLEQADARIRLLEDKRRKLLGSL